MAQSDLNIENQAFAAARADINANILALATDHSGATAPTVTYPFMTWADTANNLLKVRRSDNQAWITRGRLDQAFDGILPTDIGALTASSNLSDLANRDTAKTNLAISNGTRNRIINGCFRVDQRGGSPYTWSTTRTYTLDRWFYSMTGGGGTIAAGTISKQSFTPGQTAVTGEPESFMRITNTTQGTSLGAASAHIVGQAIEDVRLLAGQTVTVSFWAQTTITGKTLGVQLTQVFGSGGSADAIATSQAVTVTGTWQRFSFTATLPSLSGKTLGTSHHTLLNFYLQAGSNFSGQVGTFGWQGVGDVNIANVQIELASFISPFERRDYGQELRFCQRYYEEVNLSLGAHTAAITDIYSSVVFKVTKRASPSCAQKSASSFSNIAFVSLTPYLGSASARYNVPATGAYNLEAIISANAEI